MKKTLGILLFLATTYAQAQTSKFELGIEGGPNLSTVRTKDALFFFSDPKPRILFSGGFIFQYNTKKILSFKTGFSYQQKGYQIPDITLVDFSGNEYKGKVTSRLDYITLPLLAKASFGKKVNFFINAGPYVGFLLSRMDRWKGDNPGDMLEETSSSDLSGTNRLDFGVAGGMGVSIPIKELWMISVEARNYFGLMNLDESGASRVYTNTTDLRIGIAYRLGFYEE